MLSSSVTGIAYRGYHQTHYVISLGWWSGNPLYEVNGTSVLNLEVWGHGNLLKYEAQNPKLHPMLVVPAPFFGPFLWPGSTRSKRKVQILSFSQCPGDLPARAAYESMLMHVLFVGPLVETLLVYTQDSHVLYSYLWCSSNNAIKNKPNNMCMQGTSVCHIFICVQCISIYLCMSENRHGYSVW